MFCNIGKFKKYIGQKFLIISQADERFAIDTCNNQKDGGEIIVWEAGRSNPNQLWTVDCMGHIINATNPKVVIYANDTKDETRLCVTGEHENGAEAYDALARWTLTKEGEIVSQANPDQMFNICGGRASNKAAMIMWHKQGPGQKNDKWKIEVVGGYDVQRKTPDIGEFSKWVDQRFYIRCQAGEQFVVDTASKQKSPAGGDTLLWTHGRGNPNQIFTVDRQGHLFCAERPGDMMALVPVKCAKGAHVAMVKLTQTGLINAPIARWTLNQTGEIVNCGDQSLILNVCGGVLKNGPAMILWERQRTDAKNDKWRLDRA